MRFEDLLESQKIDIGLTFLDRKKCRQAFEYIAKNGKTKIEKLAEHVKIEQSDYDKYLNPLLMLGLVDYVRVPETDYSELTLTEKGEAVLFVEQS